ncbi:MAG: nickel pincer cofactor biosynthesis protein LarB [Candidatus Riflebacteria bacterium]|nr:nickel pincer cofactor biosynthesis protein LarB [Candidatus Riflebacteria bacterium]
MKAKKEEIARLIDSFEKGQLSRVDFEGRIADISADEAEIPHAIIDLGREERAGFIEAIFGAGKTSEQVQKIFSAFVEKKGRALATRCTIETIKMIVSEISGCGHDNRAGIVWYPERIEPVLETVTVVAGGTSDVPVAEEAAITLEFGGARVERVFDVGVAGIHRLFGRLELIRKAQVVIVTAGMEGALPSVVGGLVSAPVIAVPTSVGYGASFQGLAALLGMLNSCSAGITVTNIDNGFGAAVAALRILKRRNQ